MNVGPASASTVSVEPQPGPASLGGPSLHPDTTSLERQDDWLAAGLDDMVPVIAELDEAASFALVTIYAKDGGPRPVGAQMVITASQRWGFLSGGCVEADVAGHARAALDDGKPRRLTYGRDSPFFDIRLPCGGRIDLLVEPLRRDDPAILRLLDLSARRRPARYLSTGELRTCLELGGAVPAVAADGWVVDRTTLPVQRLAVVGSDPFAIAIAMAGWQQGWQVSLISPMPPVGRRPPGLDIVTAPPAAALANLAADTWTAIVVATHDGDAGETGDGALIAALRSDAGYVGAMGSRRRIEARHRALLEAGVPSAALLRLRAPIGLSIDACSPREIAISVVAEIIALRDKGERSVTTS